MLDLRTKQLLDLARGWEGQAEECEEQMRKLGSDIETLDDAIETLGGDIKALRTRSSDEDVEAIERVVELVERVVQLTEERAAQDFRRGLAWCRSVTLEEVASEVRGAVGSTSP